MPFRLSFHRHRSSTRWSHCCRPTIIYSKTTGVGSSCWKRWPGASLSRASLGERLYKAILPDARANEFSRVRAVARLLADTIAAYTAGPDITGVMGKVEQLLDESVAAREYLIPPSEAKALFDLAAVDWKALEDAFGQGRPRTAAQRLRSLLSARITTLVRLNPVRVDLVERFEKLVA